MHTLKLSSPKCVLLTMMAGICSTYATEWPPNHLVDLGWAFNDKTIVWPGGESFGYTKKFGSYIQPGNFWYAANDFKTAEHCGTHLDAPFHLNKVGWKVADIPIERFFANGVFINASQETNGNRDYQLPVEKLLQWEEVHGPIKQNSVVIISFGWAHRYGDTNNFLGYGNLSFPGISAKAAEWLSHNNNVVGVGVDTASVDHPKNTLYPVHRALAQNNQYNLENLAIAEPLPPTFKLLILPMKMSEGTGAPCRVIALL